MTPLHAALRYARAGASIVPVGHDKRPLVRWAEYQHRRATRREIVAWYRRWPGANVGVVCGAVSELIALDVEQEALWIVESEHHLPYTARVQTWSGGSHFWFAYDAAIRSTTWSIDGLHIGEVRSDGCYIIVPPSRINERLYQWVVSPWHRPPCEPPPLLEQIASERSWSTSGNVRSSDQHADGTAHNTDNLVSPRRHVSRPSSSQRQPSRSEDDQSLALRLVAEGVTDDEVIAAILARPAAEDRGRYAHSYAIRTLAAARRFANERLRAMRIDRVTRRGGRYAISFVDDVTAELAGLWLDWPITARSQERWRHLSGATGVTDPRHLVGCVVCVEHLVVDGDRRIGRLFRSVVGKQEFAITSRDRT